MSKLCKSNKSYFGKKEKMEGIASGHHIECYSLKGVETMLGIDGVKEKVISWSYEMTNEGWKMVISWSYEVINEV